MRENFNRSLDVTLAFEGGFVNHPNDPGGATNKGVTLATLRRYRKGASVVDLKAISTDLLCRIYSEGYWDAVAGDRLAAGVDLATFDYGVNSGPAAALKSLKAVAGGPDHLTVKRLCARRLSIYRGFRHWSSFGKGWTRRIAAIEAKGVAWAMAALPAVETDHVREKLAEKSAEAGKTSSRQGAGAGTAGTTTTATGIDAAQPDPALADQVAFWLLAGLFGAGLALTAFLIWRAYVNQQRKQAYAAEAAGL